jgi:DNA polymerase I
MKGFIVYQTYRIKEDKAYVFLYGRLENNESFVTINYFRPYFYIKTSDLKKALKIDKFEYENTKLITKSKEKVTKIILNIPAEVPKLRRSFEDENIQCYEADIRFTTRFLLDGGIQGSMEIQGEYEDSQYSIDRVYKEPKLEPLEWFPKLNILSLDIETDFETDEIYSIALNTNNEEVVLIQSNKKLKNAISCSSEEDILIRFIDKFHELDPDIIVGWNVIDFDFKIIFERLKHYRLEAQLGRGNSNCKLRIESDFFKESKADFPGRQVLDAMHILRSAFIKLKDYKLNTAAVEILGDKKLISDGENKRELIKQYFKKDPQKLVDYNLKDTELVLKILEKTDTLNLVIKKSLLTGMPLDRTSASIASLDSLYLKEAKKRGYVLPSSKFGDRETPLKGGFVSESVPGIYDYIIVLDFKSLYPSIIKTFNIDPFTLTDKKSKQTIEAPNGALFTTEIEGILPTLFDRIWQERDEYRKRKDTIGIYALKVLMNSFWGAVASPAYRMYNQQIGNAITSFARFTIQTSAKEIEKEGYQVIYGDSITKDRFVTMLIDGKLIIKNIGELFDDHKSETKVIRSKQVIDLSKTDIKALTVNPKTLKIEFKQINKIIRHKTNKKIYRINQKYGETICSEDHSLMIKENNRLVEVTPKELKNRPLYIVDEIPELSAITQIDLYEELKGYQKKIIYKGREKISSVRLSGNYIIFGWMNKKQNVKLKRFIKTDSNEFESLCRLLGLYIAEGSSSTPETTHSRVGASISTADIDLLKQIKEDYENLFSEVKASIIQSQKGNRTLEYCNQGIKRSIVYQDLTHKLQMMNEISAVFFKVLAGQKSSGKKLPWFIYHVEDKYKKLLLEYAILGDGNRKENDKRYIKEYKLNNFSYTTKSLNLISGISLLLRQLGFNYSMQYRANKNTYTIQTSVKSNIRLTTKFNEIDYNNYLYDLSVKDNNNFVDSCGQILLHNTDSCFVISKAKNYEEAEKIGKKLEKYINDFYQDYIKKNYKRDSKLNLQFEKVYIKFLMPKLRHGEKAAKKRYAGLMLIDGKEKIQTVGLEAVRGDWTDAAKIYQKEILDRIFHNKDIIKYTKDFIQDIRAGKYDDKLIYIKSLRKDVEGYKKTTPPHVKAARKLDKIESDKIEYIMTIEGPEPIQNQKHRLDYNHYIEKQIKPLAESILSLFGETFEEVEKGHKQSTLSDF